VTTAPWDFGYAPVTPAAGDPEATRDLVVATPAAVDPAVVAAAAGTGARAATLLDRAPLFWTLLVLEAEELPEGVAERLRAAGLAIRYVASAQRPSLALAPPLDLAGARVARPVDWAVRGVVPGVAPADTDGSWFRREGEGGVAAPPRRGGSGAGTRLAVIDDDALHVEALDLDAEIPVGIEAPPRHQPHGALMVAWATRARGFVGVAPGASARLYLVPKPGESLTALPLAIARAVADGADVILCATYVEGSASPMLDDALEVAVRLGRRGRGSAVVMPTGREASSAPSSIHVSFSLGLGEPASDPRVFCVAPGARGGGWFFWRDRRGRFRPFANRGPAVRWTAPGDDIAYPFASPGASRLFHAESSGAAALAAGVLLLVLGENPTLRRAELGAVVDATLVAEVPGVRALPEPLADRADVLPEGRDRDGHDAKHGHGRVHGGDACLFAADPLCAALIAMGEPAAARAWADARRDDPATAALYSRRLARWSVRALLGEPATMEALRVIVRHLRLVRGDEGRRVAHGHGALVHHVGLLLRSLCDAPLPRAGRVRAELRALRRHVDALSRAPDEARRFEASVATLTARAFT
jgi:hypothetical protein